MKSSEFYKTKTWKIFSKYILLKFSENNIAKCITCGKFMKINDKECCTGHLIKVFDGNSTNFSTAFEENNVRPQCNSDNRYHGGKPDLMYRNLVLEIGQEKIDQLYIKKHNSMKLDKFLLEIIYKEYKSKFDELVKIKGNPWK